MDNASEEYPLSIQATYVFVGRISAFLLSFITPIILVRIFFREEYGIYQQVLLVSMTFVEISKWGMINSLFYFYPLAKEKFSELLSQTFYSIATLGLVFLPMFYLLRFIIARLFNSDVFISLIWPIMVYFYFMLLSLILNSLFVLEKKSKLVVIYEVLNQSLRITFVVGSALIFRDIYLTVWGLSAFAFLRALVLYIYLKRNYLISPKKIRFSYLGSQIRYSSPIGSARFVGEIGKRIDKFMLSAFLSSAKFAVYSIANIGIPIISLLYTSIANVAIPKMTEYSHSKKFEQTKELWHKMIVNYAVATIPAIIFFSLLAKPIIIFLYTDQYMDSINIYRIFLLIFLAQMINPSSVLRSCKATKTIFKSHFYSMISAIVLSYILIKDFGLYGGAISVVISSYVKIGVQAIKVKEILKTKTKNFMPWVDIKKISIFSLILGVIPLCVMLIGLNNLLTIAISGTLYFLSILIIFDYLNYFKVNKITVFLKTVFTH